MEIVAELKGSGRCKAYEIKTKLFIAPTNDTGGNNLDSMINVWLTTHSDFETEIIDIKFSSSDSEKAALMIYKIK